MHGPCGYASQSPLLVLFAGGLVYQKFCSMLPQGELEGAVICYED